LGFSGDAPKHSYRIRAKLIFLTRQSFSVWDFYEYWRSYRYEKRWRNFPLPTPDKRRHDSSHVSIVVPTVDTEPGFATCLCGFLKNKPREVIIITMEKDVERIQKLVNSPSIKATRGEADLKILSIQHANKRDQLVLGINLSSGDLIALVDDDAYWESDTVLDHLLAPFQHQDIGLVGGPVR